MVYVPIIHLYERYYHFIAGGTRKYLFYKLNQNEARISKISPMISSEFKILKCKLDFVFL